MAAIKAGERVGFERAGRRIGEKKEIRKGWECRSRLFDSVEYSI
jgi:hypothetical protein